MALHNSALQASLLATIEQERSSRELSETLPHLLPTGLADRLRREGLRIGQPELLEITVLMSDIRGYSGIAETIDPAQLAAQLNEHRRAMNDVIKNCAGIVMQYMGDAVFAIDEGTPHTSNVLPNTDVRATLTEYAATWIESMSVERLHLTRNERN